VSWQILGKKKPDLLNIKAAWMRENGYTNLKYFDGYQLNFSRRLPGAFWKL
jgi:hypothetical protein